MTKESKLYRNKPQGPCAKIKLSSISSGLWGSNYLWAQGCIHKPGKRAALSDTQDHTLHILPLAL